MLKISPLVVTLLLALAGSPALGQRSLGIDVSAWQGSISQANWNTIRSVDNREFAFVRSSRGGTTGFYNQSDPNNNQGNNTLSQRYDDPYFVQNITRATNAGVLTGPYHYSRPDIVATTPGSGGIANTGADEADHFIEMAGAWMRPGYLLPVFDLEDGEAERTDAQITQFSIDFSERLHDVMGIRPIMYINGNYAAFVVQSPIEDYFPVLWTARYANQADPDSIPVQTGHPKDTFSGFYGPWDSPSDPHPWDFWQYASTARISGYRNGGANIDVNVAQGGTEFLKDHLVPALWMNDSSGDWSTLANWNSGQTPIAPVQGPGQVPRVGPLFLPQVRLPGPDDTVVLERENADIAVSLAFGDHEIRKLVAREELNISGGSLTMNYTPVADSTTYSAKVGAPVTITGGLVSAHTIEVEARNTLTLGGGSVSFESIRLEPLALNPAVLEINGPTVVGPLGSNTATIAAAAGPGDPGVVSLSGGGALLVNDGAPDVDVSIDAEVTGGSLLKTGDGVLRLTKANTHTSTLIGGGTLLVSNQTGSATGAGPVAVQANGTLGGTGTAAGIVIADGTISPGNSIGTLGIGSLTMQAGSTLDIEIDSLSSFDTVDLSGLLTIDPATTINVTLADGFTPQAGEVYPIITGATGVTGEFGSVVTNGVMLTARNVADGVVLEVASAIAGDFNGDGMVDNGDLNLLLANWGAASVPAEWVNGFAGTVDNDELNALLANWGEGVNAAVPEPLSAVSVLVAVGIAGVSGRRSS